MVLLKVFKDFAATTSIHAFTFLVNPQLSVVKRISWAVLIIGAVIYAGYQLNISVVCKFGWFLKNEWYLLSMYKKKYFFMQRIEFFILFGTGKKIEHFIKIFDPQLGTSMFSVYIN